MVGTVGRILGVHGLLMARTVINIDVDADLVEEQLRRDPIDVNIPGLGKYEFPGVRPASAALRVARWAQQGKTEITATDAAALLGDMVPEAVLRSWHEAGFDPLSEQGSDVAVKVVEGLFAEYDRRDAEIEAAAPAPKAAPPAVSTPPQFSGAGPSSSPTSSGNTPPPFPVT